MVTKNYSDTVSIVAVLFNPFHSKDDVFLRNPEKRKEYVLNDHTALYYGTKRRQGYMRWYVGHFESQILDAVLDLLDEDIRFIRNPNKGIQLRKSPVWISRIASALVNCSDEKGILWGRWDGDYTQSDKDRDFFFKFFF